MKKFGSYLGLSAAIAVGTLLWVAAPASAFLAQAGSAPHVVTCSAADAGLQGPPGFQGDTGATGPSGPAGGPERVAHVRTLDCADLPGVCAFPVTGLIGPKGPAGATGPSGPAGPIGVVRSPHPPVPPCDAFPRECVYFNRGPQGATGPAGDTGVQGPTGSAGGSARRPHGGSGITTYGAGETVTLAACALPSTGVGSHGALIIALSLIGCGVVALASRRRRFVG